MTTTPVVVPVADRGVLVVFDDQISDDETHARIHALDAALSRNPPTGLTEIVPAMTTGWFDRVFTRGFGYRRGCKYDTELMRSQPAPGPIALAGATRAP